MADDEFQENENTRTAIQRGVDHDDLNREMNGSNASRISRFGLADNHARVKRQKKRDKEQLDHALKFASEAHRRAYEAALGALEEAEYAIADALNEFAQRLAETGRALVAAQAELDGILDRASTLPNGTHTFLDDDGFAYTEDDRQLTDDEMATVDWKEGADGRKSFRQSRARRDQADADVAAANERHAWLIGRDTRITEINDELHDKDILPDLERSLELEDQLRTIADEVTQERAVTTEYEASRPSLAAAPNLDL